VKSKRTFGGVGVALLVSLGLSACFQNYTIEDCIPLMETYGEMAEDTAHFLCGSFYHSSTQAEFNAAIGDMQAAIRDGRTMQDDLQSGIDSYFSDLGIDAPDLGN
jgi:hypothetical protein